MLLIEAKGGLYQGQLYYTNIIVEETIHASPGSNQMNQNVEPKTFFYEVKSIYNVEIRGCWVLTIKSIQNRNF